MNTKQCVRTVLRRVYDRLGYGLIPYNPGTSFACRVGRILASRRIVTVLDVGGNEGQYGLWLREIGYRGQVISIEPERESHAALVRTAGKDGRWRVLPPMALGAVDGVAEFNVARNSQCSSFFQPEAAVVRGISDFEIIERRQVRMATLASVVSEYGIGPTDLYLKLDVQGFEMNVLRGGGSWLERVPAVQLEASAVPFYSGESGILELSSYLLDRGFRFGTINPMLVDADTGCMGQCDVIYVRTN